LKKTECFLEQDVERLNRINQLYRQQIDELENDNLALYSKLQEMKAQQDAVVSTQIIELDRSVMHNQELTLIIRVLEEEIRVKDD
jgi:hypothetical protein